MLHKWHRDKNGRYTVKNVAIFMTHGSRGKDFTVKTLNKMVKNTTESRRVRGKPKLFIGHNGFEEAGPVIGHAANLRVVGELIYADYVNLRPAVFSEIVNGAYPQRSVELCPVTLMHFDGIALLGSAEPHFPFEPIELELGGEERATLNADIDNDKSFHFSSERTEKRELVLYSWPNRSNAVKNKKLYIKNKEGKLIARKVYTKDKDGKAVKFELTPDDVPMIETVVEEATAPLKEMLSMAINDIKALQENAGIESEKEEEAGDEADEDAEDSKREEDSDTDDEDSKRTDDDDGDDEDSTQDKRAEDDDDDDEEDSKRNADDDDTDNKRTGDDDDKDSKRSQSLDSFAEKLALKAENDKLKSDKVRGKFKKKIRAVIDERQYANAKELIRELTDNVMSFPTNKRDAALAMVQKAYASNGVPSGLLPDTTKKEKKGNKPNDKIDRFFDEREADLGQKTFGSYTREQFKEAAKIDKTLLERIS